MGTYDIIEYERLLNWDIFSDPFQMFREINFQRAEANHLIDRPKGSHFHLRYPLLLLLLLLLLQST
jgi:hypothetical protein